MLQYVRNEVDDVPIYLYSTILAILNKVLKNKSIDIQFSLILMIYEDKTCKKLKKY